jgi:hypothetical protein
MFVHFWFGFGMQQNQDSENARKFQQAIAKTNGLSRAADLLEEAFGLTKEAEWYFPCGYAVEWRVFSCNSIVAEPWSSVSA